MMRVPVQVSQPDAIRADAGPCVCVVPVVDGSPVNVMRLRWLYDGGLGPPTLVGDMEELLAYAGELAVAVGGPSVLMVPEGTDNVPEFIEVQAEPVDAPTPIECYRRISESELDTQIDEDVAEGNPEWLVVSYGEANHASQTAIASVRNDGQRVRHLKLQRLWPLPEAAIHRAMRGIQHIVVPEFNHGQVVFEFRRLMPDKGIVPVDLIVNQDAVGAIEGALRFTPRCC